MKSPKPIEFLSRRSRAHDGSVNDGKADRIESVSSQRRQRTNLLVEGGGRSEGLAQVDVLQRHLLDVAVQLRHLNGQPIDARLQLLRSSSFRKKKTQLGQALNLVFIVKTIITDIRYLQMC